MIYISTVQILEMLNDYIITNTIIVFDEWVYGHNKNNDDHEQKAFYEWVKKYNRKFEFLKFLPDRDQKGDVEQKTVRILNG